MSIKTAESIQYDFIGILLPLIKKIILDNSTFFNFSYLFILLKTSEL